jgi:hypothetical protein
MSRHDTPVATADSLYRSTELRSSPMSSSMLGRLSKPWTHDDAALPHRVSRLIARERVDGIMIGCTDIGTTGRGLRLGW